MSSVPTVTTKAIMTSAGRCLVSSGSRNTAARVTTPRMPAQAITAGYCHGGEGSTRRTAGISLGR